MAADVLVYGLVYNERKHMSEQTQNFLARHLRAKKNGGHLGRGNPEMIRIADKVGLSVHMVQSLALGRRTMRDEIKAQLQDAIRG